MTCKMMHQICYGFYWSIKKWSKLGQKADFLLILRVFLFMPSYTPWVTPQDFAKWKTLLRYISVISFISIAFVVVKSKIFKVFHNDSPFMKWSLLGGFGPLLFFFCLFFYLDFLPQPLTNQRTAGERGGHFFNSSLPLPPASQTLRY